VSIQRRCFVLLALLLLGGIRRPAAAQAFLAPVYNPSNGHWYQVVPVPGGIAWPAARAAAAALSYAGYPGHLVTITSPAENQFLVSQLPLGLDNHWRVGGYQDETAPDYSEPAGGWRWITGEPWGFTNWHAGEPNNVGGENLLEIHSDGTWNDTADQPPGGGYIVEYEPALPPGIAATQLTLTPNPVTGGQPATGQVILSQPAGAGGVIVTLASSNPAVAVVPAVVTVPAGSFTVAFPVITFPVVATASVTISAGCQFGTVSATLLVAAAGLPLPPVYGAAPPPVYDPANGHWYQEVRLPYKITWPDAKAAAEQLSFAGFPGHLATVTSAAENQFVSHYMTASGPLGDIWIGGYQNLNAPDFSEPASGWRWVTGEPWSYTSWSPGEPNNGSGGEDVLETNSGGTWNDLIPAPGVTAYLVEYEAPPAPGALQLLLYPNPVPGGLLALGQVIVPQPAGPGGMTVNLTSSSPTVALVPASAVVLPGARTVTFPIVTFPVTALASVTISAGSAGGPAAATLLVLPLTAVPSPPSSPQPVSPLAVQPAAALPAPSNLTARPQPGPDVDLTWTDNSTDEDAFAIWRRTGSSDWTRVGVVAPNTTTFLDRNGAPGTTYTYRVRATRGNVASAWSNEASATTP
jgi:hypothetical protein